MGLPCDEEAIGVSTIAGRTLAPLRIAVAVTAVQPLAW